MFRKSMVILGMFTVALLIGTATEAKAGPSPKLKMSLETTAPAQLVSQTELAGVKDSVEQATIKEKSKSQPGTFWSNGKKGMMSQLNVTMLMKSGALSKISPNMEDRTTTSRKTQVQGNRRWWSNGKKGNAAQLNLPMLIKSGAFSRPSLIGDDKNPVGTWSGWSGGTRRWWSNGKKASQGALNVTMLSKSGVFSKPSPVGDRTVIRSIKPVVPTETGTRTKIVRYRSFTKPPRNINQRRLFRRQRVGNFCSGRDCSR